jgi:hypothetical protein
VGLAALLAVISIPLVQGAVALHRLDSSSILLAGKIAQARSEALKRNRVVWVRIDNGARSSRIQTTNAGGATVNLGDPDFLPVSVNFSGLPGPTLDMQFDSMGRLIAPPKPCACDRRGSTSSGR